MLHIEKGQKLQHDSTLITMCETGEYEETDLIMFAITDSPDIGVGYFEAKFVVYGSEVYQ